jgi:L-fuculose-phosphate aldolase
MSVSPAQRRAELVAVGAALERQGLLRGCEGNLSCRLGDGTVLVTPRGVPKGRLAGWSLVAVGLDGPLPPEASSEVAMHLEVYRRVASIAAIVHAHPPAVLALTLAWPSDPAPDPSLLAEGEVLLATVGVIPPHPPGSQELARAAAATLAGTPVAVMLHHGAVAVAESPLRALERMELLELLARVELLRRARAVPTL